MRLYLLAVCSGVMSKWLAMALSRLPVLIYRIDLPILVCRPRYPSYEVS